MRGRSSRQPSDLVHLQHSFLNSWRLAPSLASLQYTKLMLFCYTPLNAKSQSVLPSVANGASASFGVRHLHAAFCMLHAACCILLVACCLLHSACCMLHVACCMLHAACCTLHVACCMLHAACCKLHVACCMLHAACCMLLPWWCYGGSRW